MLHFVANVIIADEAQSQFESLPLAIQVRMEKIIVRLANWPDVSGAKPLRGELSGLYRIRTGDYRLQFSVARNVVTVEKVGHRDGFYGD